MSEQQGGKTPKSLADVSHLFFSQPDAAGPPGDESTDADEAAPARETASGDQGRWSSTLVIPVTGSGRPGCSTIAVNLAHALLPWGRVALLDADPRLPNARFYLGLPSSNYLAHLSGGTPNGAAMLDGGLVAGDWVSSGTGPDEGHGAGEALYMDIDGAGRRALDIAVVDIPLSRLGLLRPIASLVGPPVLVAGPGFEGFVGAYAAATFMQSATLPDPQLVVNRVDGPDEGARFAAKMTAGVERLLGVRMQFAGALRREPRLGSRQRERGPIVRSEPDSIAALSLREVAANVLAAARGGDDGDDVTTCVVSREGTP